MSTSPSVPSESRVTPETAREFAHVYALFLALEHSIVQHRDDEDPAELQALVEKWAGVARVVGQRRSRIEQEIIVAPIGAVE